MIAPPIVGIATSQGGRPTNADYASCHRHPGPAGTVALSLVDGIGNKPDDVEAAYLAAEFAARIGARRGAMEGVMAAAAILTNPTMEFPTPDSVIALAVARPAEPTVISHVGDVLAYAFDGTELLRLTTPHTKAERLLNEGQPADSTRRYRHVPITSLARAAPTTISLAETFAPVVVLLSDGVHTALDHQQLTDLIRAHSDDAQACAQALVDAARERRPEGDNATAAVLIHPDPTPVDVNKLGR